MVQGEGHSPVSVDALLPDLLLLPPGTDLHAHAWVKDGRLVLQVGAGVGLGVGVQVCVGAAEGVQGGLEG